MAEALLSVWSWGCGVRWDSSGGDVGRSVWYREMKDDLALRLKMFYLEGQYHCQNYDCTASSNVKAGVRV